MLRVIMIEGLLFLFPWIAWWLFCYLRFGLKPALRDMPCVTLCVLGMGLLLVGIIPLARYHKVSGYDLKYRPAFVVDGEITSGSFGE